MDKETVKKALFILTGIAVVVLMSVAIFQSPVGGDSQANNGGHSAHDTTASPEYQVPEPPPLLSNGTTAPDFTLSTHDGQMISLSDYEGKQYVLVELLATRCPHCQESTKTLKVLNQKHGNTLKVIAINAGDRNDEPSTTRAFIDEYELTYPLLEKPDEALITAYKLFAFPTFYLVDKNGKIQWSHRGTFEETAMADLEAVLK